MAPMDIYPHSQRCTLYSQTTIQNAAGLQGGLSGAFISVACVWVQGQLFYLPIYVRGRCEGVRSGLDLRNQVVEWVSSVLRGGCSVGELRNGARSFHFISSTLVYCYLISDSATNHPSFPHSWFHSISQCLSLFLLLLSIEL